MPWMEEIQEKVKTDSLKDFNCPKSSEELCGQKEKTLKFQMILRMVTLKVSLMLIKGK